MAMQFVLVSLKLFGFGPLLETSWWIILAPTLFLLSLFVVPVVVSAILILFFVAMEEISALSRK